MQKIVSIFGNPESPSFNQFFEAAINGLTALLLVLAITLFCEPSHAGNSLHARISANLNSNTPHWLGSPGKTHYAKLLVARYQQSDQSDSIEQLLLDNPWPQYSAMFSHYLQYRLLNDSGYWCASSSSTVFPELAAYLLWLQGDLIHDDVSLGKLAAEVCSARPVTVAQLSVAGSEIAKLMPGLEPALKQFQKRFGLKQSGRLDEPSIKALQRDAGWVANRLRINLLRMAKLDSALGDRYLIANIPAFEVSVFERYETVLTLKAIVGKTSRQTPRFSSEISSVVLNPGWNIPPKIAYRDLIPKQIKQADYLSKRNISVYADWSSEQEIDPTSIDWSAMEQDFPYRMKQAPGPQNALGRLKFVTPNSRAIYLHDTNARGLFAKPARAFSSGCVRLEQPERLARYVLDSQYTRGEVESLLNSTQTRSVKVRETLPVHYVYWTSWVNDDGTLLHSQDVYDLDSNPHQIRPHSPATTLAYGTIGKSENAAQTKS